MKYNIGDIIPFEQTQEATDYVNSIEGGYYLEDYAPDKNGNMQLIVRQFVFPSPTPEEIEAQLQKHYTDLIQSMLDKEAQKLGYDSCLSVCSYTNTGISKFDCEGEAFRVWRSAVWNTGYQILDAVKAGTMEVPSEEELIELLPKLTITYSE